ncbi:hypothetical protein ACR9PT_03910 [Piscirickettsia salmonis]|uniref:hypothetical protein n=1 Tax=Piscirickettsia salmonis TaxID=1238 RepID=UPI003EB7B8F9
MIKRFMSFLSKSFSLPFLKESYKFVFSIYKKTLATQKNIKENEKIPIESSGMLESKIATARKAFLILAVFYFIFFVAILTYTILLVFHKSYMTAIVGAAGSLVCFALFFKYHFWLTQIKCGYLGMTLKEWYQQLWK